MKQPPHERRNPPYICLLSSCFLTSNFSLIHLLRNGPASVDDYQSKIHTFRVGPISSGARRKEGYINDHCFLD